MCRDSQQGQRGGRCAPAVFIVGPAKLSPIMRADSRLTIVLDARTSS